MNKKGNQVASLVRLSCLVIALLVTAPARAQSTIWIGSSGDWSTPTLWSCNCVPGGSSEVDIANGTINVDIDASVSLLIGTGTLTLNGHSLTGSNPVGIQTFGTIQLSNGASITAPFIGAETLFMDNSSLNGLTSSSFASISSSTLTRLNLGGSMVLSNSTIGANSNLQFTGASSIRNSTVSGTIGVLQGADVVINGGSRITATVPGVSITSGSISLQGASQLNVTSGLLTLSSPFATAAVTVDGAGTAVNLTDAPFELTGFGNATATIQNGGTIKGDNNDIFLGAAQDVGFTATSLMLVTSGGTVSARNVTLYGRRNSPTTLTVETVDSSLTASGTLSVIGGTVNVSQQASLITRNIDIQQGGKIVVDQGAKLTATASNSLSEAVQVGSIGDGTLTLANGARGTAVVPVVLGVEAGSKGTMTLSNPNTVWESGDAVIVGYKGTGSLLVQTFAQLTTLGATDHLGGVIGSQTGSTGTATVENALWDVNGNMQVGASGTGTLNVQEHGLVRSQDAVLGFDSESKGTVTVTGDQAQWLNSGILTIGAKGNGVLTVAQRGQVSSASAVIGADFPFNAALVSGVTVTGAGTQWNNSGNLDVGGKASATLTIENGGHVTDQNARIAVSLGAFDSARVSVTGADSVWDNSGQVTVGVGGTAKIAVSERGRVSAQSMIIGASPAGFEPTAVSVDTSGELNVQGNLTVGGQGNGALSLDTGGTVRVGQALIIGQNGQGIVDANNGAVLTSNSGQIGAGGLGVATIHGGARWDAAGAIVIGSSQAPGTLAVQNSGLVRAAQVIVTPTGTLDAQGGTIVGQVVNNGGAVTPGDATGIMRITGDYIQNSGTLLFEIDGVLPDQFDQLLVSGKATLNGGRLQVVFGNGFQPSAGESFDLISADLGFANLGAGIEVTGLSSGLRFTDSATANGFVVSFENAPAVPEPSSCYLLGAGLVSMLGWHLRRKRGTRFDFGTLPREARLYTGATGPREGRALQSHVDEEERARSPFHGAGREGNAGV